MNFDMVGRGIGARVIIYGHAYHRKMNAAIASKDFLV